MIGCCQLAFVAGLSTLHVLHHGILFLIQIATVGVIANKFSLAVKKKKIIQIVSWSCTQRKLRAGRVPFYTEKQFYDNICMIFVTPFPWHPYFKERIGSWFEIFPAIVLTSKKEDVITVKLFVLISIFWRIKSNSVTTSMFQPRWTLCYWNVPRKNK